MHRDEYEDSKPPCKSINNKKYTPGVIPSCASTDVQQNPNISTTVKSIFAAENGCLVVTAVVVD